MDADEPVVGEVVTAGPWIVWTGRRGSAPVEYRRARAIDLKGRLLLPAFSDAHTHFMQFAHSLRSIDLDGVTTIKEALRRIGQHATVRNGRSGWITGQGLDLNSWKDRRPTRHELDRVVPKRPAAFFTHDQHALLVNSAALRLAGIGRESIDPAGGRIERDAGGDPTGFLFETAYRLVWDRIPQPSPLEAERLILEAQVKAHEVGVAAIADMGEPGTLRAFAGLQEKGKLKVRLWKSVALKDLDSAIAVGLRSGVGDRWIKIGAVKIFLDGALGSQTAWTYKPYAGNRSNYGICRMERADFDAAVRRAAAHGLSVCVHAIGDAAVGQAIEVLRKHESRFPRCQPPRIEHLQLIDPRDVSKLVRSRIIASMQPSHLLTDRDYADRHWGQRASNAFRFRTLWDRGVIMAFGSDVPIERLAPLEGIGAAICRCRARDRRGAWYPGQRLSVWGAVWGFTVGAAIASGDTGTRGKIAPGYLADMVVLDRNIFTVKPTDIFQTQVAMTFVDGEYAYGV